MIFDITNCVFPPMTEHFEGHKIKGLFSINNTHYIVTDIIKICPSKCTLRQQRGRDTLAFIYPAIYSTKINCIAGAPNGFTHYAWLKNLSLVLLVTKLSKIVAIYCFTWHLDQKCFSVWSVVLVPYDKFWWMDLHNHLLYAFNCWNVNWGIQAFSVLCHIFDIITIISSWIIQCMQWWPLELEAFYNEMF